MNIKPPARPHGPIDGNTVRSAVWRSVGLDRLLAIGLAALTAGCGTTGSLPETSSQLRTVGAETAFVMPPPGGPAIVGVLEQRYVNGVSQDIALSTNSRVPGQNSISVRLIGPSSFGASTDSTLPSRPISATGINSEIRKAVPGVRMGTSPYYVQNRYGPFGYAVGRASSGDLCMFAWQQVRAAGQTTIIRNRGSISIRLRICDARMSEERLVAVMYGISINAFFRDASWNPYGSPPAPSATLGGLSAPVYPADGQGFQTVTGNAPRAAPRPRAATPRRAAVVTEPQPAALPQAVGPVVPVPPVPAGSQLSPRPAGTAPVGGLDRASPATLVPPPPCTRSANGGATCN